MNVVLIDEKSSTVVLGDFRTKATEIYSPPSGQAVQVRLSSGVVAVIAIAGGESTSAWLELWSGEPGSSDGVALIGDDDAQPRSWKNIPMCECGDRGCGNASGQFSKNVDADSAGDLMRILDTLPHAGAFNSTTYAWHAEPPDETNEPNREVLEALNLQ